ncbi:SEC-C metal-binding domain-containing protein [Paenibacillus sp. CAU 1782]
MKKLGRNDACHCGSGLKYKKCCLSKDEAGKVVPITSSRPLSLTDMIDQQLQWPNELHQQIAHHFLQNTTGLYSDELIGSFIKIWNAYAHESRPISQKLGTFPAALEYLLCQNYDYPATQSELAKKYGISATTLSNRAEQIYFFLEDHADMLTVPNGQQHSAADNPGSRVAMEQQIARIHALLDEQNFETIEEANAFLQKNMHKAPSGRNSQSKEEQASDLIYSAWEESDPKRRIKLAQDALALHPESGDAYNILAECTSTPKEAAYFYRQGMKVEENRLGKAFFEENKGYFWGYLPTRPFMRAKFGLAQICAMMDNMAEAIQHYRELLELNPNDNQGVRELLLTAYLETEDWKSANLLFQQYSEDESAAYHYSRVLVEYNLNGKTSRLTSLIKTAISHNPFVPAYLQGTKRMPRSVPNVIGFGDEREAIVYVSGNRHLWLAKGELLNLLSK